MLGQRGNTAFLVEGKLALLCWNSPSANQIVSSRVHVRIAAKAMERHLRLLMSGFCIKKCKCPKCLTRVTSLTKIESNL